MRPADGLFDSTLGPPEMVAEVFLGVSRRQSGPVRVNTIKKSLCLDTGHQLDTPRVQL